MKVLKIAFSPIRSDKFAFSKISVFLTGEHTNNTEVPISMHYFGSSRFMPIFILVGKVVLLVCIKSTLIMSFLALTIDKTSLNSNRNSFIRSTVVTLFAA